MNFFPLIFGFKLITAVCWTIVATEAFGGGSPRQSLAFVDLSYAIGNSTVFYPGSKEFTLHRDQEGFKGEFWYSSFSFCMGEHGGTHLDAPYHFYKEGWTVEEIPEDRLINVPATIIDVEKYVTAMETPGNFKLQVKHLIEHERNARRRIPSHGLVLVYTGWSKFWPNKINYLGYENATGNDTGFNLRFPGISAEAIKWLSEERQVVGVGIDSPSVDQGMDQHYPVHVYAASRQMYNLENVANLHLLLCPEPSPACKSNNFRALVIPLKIVGATGAPARILAMFHSDG